MKQITIEQAYKLLDDASAVILDGVVTYPSLDDTGGEWLFLSWSDDKGRDYGVKFDENAEPHIVAGKLHLVDTEGEDCVLALLQPWDLPEP